MHKNFLIFICLILNSTCFAQLNFNAGFTYGRILGGVNNDIIQKVNDNNVNLVNYVKMKPIKALYGFHFGTQFKFDIVALSLGWDSKVQVNDFKGDDSTGDDIYRELFYRVTSGSAGIEFFPINRFSFGGTIDLNRLRIRSENNLNDNRYTVMKDKGLSSHFFVSLNISGSELLSISLQPYVQIPWKKFNLTELESELDTGVGITDFDDGFMNYGIRLLFRNGRQNY